MSYPTIKPWAQGAFELIRHAEEHVRSGNDFDRRMALISFDNSIEVAIFTYLTLSPIQRDNQEFSREQVKTWLNNFHSKLEFLEYFVKTKMFQPMQFQREDIVFYHKLRNELYHQATGLVPDARHLNEIREVALWVFKTLFNIDPEPLLANLIADTQPGAEVETDIISSEGALTNVSDETAFLETMISIRRDLNMLMRMRTGELSTDTGQLSALDALNRGAIPDNRLITSYKALLEQAELLRAKIVQGDSDSDESTVRDLSRRLTDVSDRINGELRTFQTDIVERAIEATSRVAGDSGTRRAGIVWQAPGTGITASLISYVVRVASMEQLNNPLIIVASGLNSLVDQTYGRFVALAGSLGPGLERVADSARLLKVLESGDKKIILTTFQRILRISRNAPFERSDIVFVGHDLPDNSGVLNRTFPNAIFILFTNTFLPNNEMGSTYGELIARYNLSQAINDNIATPVHYESRRISPTILHESRELLEDQFAAITVSIDYIREIAIDLIKHFESRNAAKPVRALIVTRRIDVANELVRTILSLRPEWHADIVGPISAGLDSRERNNLLSRIADRDDQFKLALIGAGMLPGIDIQNVKMIYVTEALSENTLLKVIGLLGRGSDKNAGLLVDYGQNLGVVQSLMHDTETMN